MPSWSSCPCYSHTCLSQIALAMSSLLATFRLLLSLLRTPANASGYFCLISTMKVLPTVEQSYPQFTREPSSILYFFEWNGCHTVWSCTERGISFYELCLHMASLFFSQMGASQKNGFQLPFKMGSSTPRIQRNGSQLPLEMGCSTPRILISWNGACCFV